MATQTITSRTRVEETPSPPGGFPKDTRGKEKEDKPPRQKTNVTKDNDDIQPKDEGDNPDKTPKPKKNGGDSAPSSDDGNNGGDMPNRWQGTR